MHGSDKRVIFFSPVKQIEPLSRVQKYQDGRKQQGTPSSLDSD